jgi:hypothetical protein
MRAVLLLILIPGPHERSRWSGPRGPRAADALGVKQELEKALAQDGKPAK